MTAPYQLRDALDDREAALKLVAVAGASVLLGTAPGAVLGDAALPVALAYIAACVGLLLATMYGADRRLREV
ncbi:hypothetical protein DJ72_14110, partial [Halorubrum distributum]